ncbi:MAG: multicopper oxidase domain-containing protein [Geminicoccaceae bacterium]
MGGGSRSRALAIGCVGLAIMVFAGQARSEEDGAVAEAAAARASNPLPSPIELRSRNGKLEGTLTSAPSDVRVNGREVYANVLNGSFLAPTLVVRPGDAIRLRAVNRIGKSEITIDGPQPTNIHYHGMDVSPIPPGDNVFIKIEPKESYKYDVKIPDDHPLGLHWYHAHVHGYVEDQIGSGISGMLIVDGFMERYYPQLAGLQRRTMVFHDFTFPGFVDGQARTKTLNGTRYATISMRPGEWQIWQMGNLGADAFFKVALEGHKFWILEYDGNFLLKAREATSIFMPAGSRNIVAVQASTKKGSYPLYSLNVETGPQGDPNPTVQLSTVVVEGSPVGGGAAILARLQQPPANIGLIQPNPKVLAKAPITRTRYIDFSETPNGDTFFINGKQYNENRIDTTSNVGATERWILRNYSGEFHVFHIHQTEFLVKSASGPGAGQIVTGVMRDVVNIPYAVKGKPGQVEIILPFTDPIIVGEFVYHCHIVGHEDAGMMANIQIKPRRSLAGDLWDEVRQFASSSMDWVTGAPPVDLESPTICRPDRRTPRLSTLQASLTPVDLR